MIEKIRQSCSSFSSVNLTNMFVLLTNNIVCRVFSGRTYIGREFKELLEIFMELLCAFNVGDYIPWLAWLNRINGFDGRVDKIAKEFDQFLDDIIEEHMISQNQRESENESNGSGSGGHEGESPQDFVHVLLEIQRDKMDGFLVDGDSIKSIILGIFLAGTNTTYTAQEWTIAELARHPKIMKKLQNEVREIEQGKLDITEDDLEKMHYLKEVIKEKSVKSHTPIPLLVPRESTQDIKVMDPFTWKDPEEFRLERFLNTSIDFKGHDFELIPFGARRGCPGKLFAMHVNELALANVVHKFEFSLLDQSKEEDLDMTEATETLRAIPLPTPSHWLLFFSSTLVKWVDVNLRSPPWPSTIEDQWTLVFMGALTSLWYWHSQQLHDPTFQSPFLPIDIIAETLGGD
ncbi:hypothetical protein ACSBR2_004453 [Camellia fascicularis]